MEHAGLASDVSGTKTEASQPNGSTTANDEAAPETQVNPWAPDEGRYVTLEEYWAKWYENPYPDMDVSYEWNNGRLEAKPLPNAPQLELYNWFLDLLRRYLSTYDIARLINLETGFVLTVADTKEASGERVQVRKPDVGVILNSNPTPWGEIEQRHFSGVCDVVIEAVSDSTRAEVLRDTEEKKLDYALGGVKEYYILDPSGEHMHFFRREPAGQYEEIPPDAEGVIRSETLPGLQFRLEDLRRLPQLLELALDDVYSGYVIPDHKVAVTRAEEAELQAEAEARRADAEAQRAEAEAQRADAEARRADAENAARQQALERVEELEAELARFRRRSS